MSAGWGGGGKLEESGSPLFFEYIINREEMRTMLPRLFRFWEKFPKGGRE